MKFRHFSDPPSRLLEDKLNFDHTLTSSILGLEELLKETFVESRVYPGDID